MKKQNHSVKFMERYTNSRKMLTLKMVKVLTSSWSIGAIITAVSAWTAGILYV